MSKSKIVIIANTSWFIFNFKSGLIRKLKSLGYDVVVIAPNDEYSTFLKEMGCDFYDININNKGTNPIEDIFLIYRFYKLFITIKPDIILPHTIKPNLYASFAAKMCTIPVVNTITGLGTVFLNNRLSSKIARFLYKISLKSTKKVFFENIDDKQLFIDRKLVQSNKTDVIAGSGIDTEKFKPVKLEKQDEDTIKFLFIARLVKDKGLLEFIDAARAIYTQKEHYQVTPEFYILGAYYPGNPTAITDDQMHQWEEEGIVTYLGVSNNVQSVINMYDCIVLPSYREGLSRVLLEAASMAKPIVTTNVPGCKEVVEDGVNGYLCMVKDIDSLSNAMEKMILLTNEQRKEMGRKGRGKIIAEFDEKLVIQKYQEAIASLCDYN